MAVGELVRSFDPPTDWAIASTWIHSNISDCLVWRDRATAKFIPWLATDWEVMDSLNWKFNLRKGVEFHNGEPYNAEAAKFTIDRILADNKMLVYNQWTFVKEVKVLGEHSIQISTKAPEPAMLSKLAGTGCQAIPPKYMKEVGPEVYARKPVGTGPFKFVQEIKDDRVVLEAFDKYWQGRPDIDVLTFRAIPETSTRINELLTGGVDLVESAPPQDWDRIEKSANAKLVVGMGSRTALINLRAGDQQGNTNYLLNNKALRAAIEHAIDKNQLVQLVGGMGVPTRTRVTPPTFASHEGLYGEKNGNVYNLSKAKELLKEGNYKGEEIELVTSTGAWLLSREVAEAIAAMLQAAGINVKLRVLDVTTYREQVSTPASRGEVTFQHMAMDPLGNSFFDPWIAMLGYTNVRGARFGHLNDEVDKIVTAAGTNMNFTEREQQYRRAQELIAEDRYSIFLYHMKESYALNSRLDWTVPPDGFLWMGNAKVR